MHEVAHAAACLIFGMPIVRMSLYNFFPSHGTMGFVNFAYRPGSIIHMIGRVVQGVAPLLLGGAITIWLLNLTHVAVFPERTVPGIFNWANQVGKQTIESAMAMALSTPAGALTAFFVVCVAIHAIPSRSDIRIGLSGLISAVVVVSLIVLGIDTLSKIVHPVSSLYPSKNGIMNTHVLPLLDRVLHWVAHWIHLGLFWALYGAVAVISLSISATAVFILIPAGTVLAFKWAYRGLANTYEEKSAISIVQLKQNMNSPVNEAPGSQNAQPTQESTEYAKAEDSTKAPPKP